MNVAAILLVTSVPWVIAGPAIGEKWVYLNFYIARFEHYYLEFVSICYVNLYLDLYIYMFDN